MRCDEVVDQSFEAEEIKEFEPQWERSPDRSGQVDMDEHNHHISSSNGRG